jgi:putative tryptophan/tyrosine transport system substrate-binding protein
LGLCRKPRTFGLGRFGGLAMRRREFIAGTAATAALSFAWPACAQTNTRPPGVKRLAIFHPTDPVELITSSGRPQYKAYFEELKRPGFVEGQNLIVERYSALGETHRFGDFARQIVATHPDVILPFGGLFTKEIIALAPGIPMIGPTSDPVTFGLSTSLARPDKSFTGVVVDAGLEIWTKRVQLLLETARKLTTIGILGANPYIAPPVQGGLNAHVRDAAQRAGIKAKFIVVAGKNVDRAAYERILDTVIVGSEKLDQAAYERAFEAMKNEGVDGIVVSDAAEHNTYRQLIVDLAAGFHIAAIYSYRPFVEVGGLMAYGVDTLDMLRRVANMTSEVLRGAKPSDIPFYQQIKYDLVLNQKAARSLGLEFPPALLMTASEVIE